MINKRKSLKQAYHIKDHLENMWKCNTIQKGDIALAINMVKSLIKDEEESVRKDDTLHKSNTELTD